MGFWSSIADRWARSQLRPSWLGSLQPGAELRVLSHNGTADPAKKRRRKIRQASQRRNRGHA